MKFLLILVPLFMGSLLIFGPLLDRDRSWRERVRAVTRRLRGLQWLAGGLLIAGLALAPDKGRVLWLLGPGWLLLGGLRQGWQRWAPASDSPDVDLVKMKRVALARTAQPNDAG